MGFLQSVCRVFAVQDECWIFRLFREAVALDSLWTGPCFESRVASDELKRMGRVAMGSGPALERLSGMTGMIMLRRGLRGEGKRPSARLQTQKGRTAATCNPFCHGACGMHTFARVSLVLANTPLPPSSPNPKPSTLNPEP